MAPVGFSTGTLAMGDFRLGLTRLRGRGAAAIELSALRDDELPGLIDALDELDLAGFSYISVHAPSCLSILSERQVYGLLLRIFERQWPVVVHPDVIEDHAMWAEQGDLVCVENMDKRKSVGRTAAELKVVFDKLSQASFCFDIGHARQVDPTMFEARLILKEHGARLRQVHISEVNSSSRHEPLNFAATQAFHRVARLIPMDIPLILETPVEDKAIQEEMAFALRALARLEADGRPGYGVI